MILCASFTVYPLDLIFGNMHTQENRNHIFGCIYVGGFNSAILIQEDSIIFCSDILDNNNKKYARVLLSVREPGSGAPPWSPVSGDPATVTQQPLDREYRTDFVYIGLL